MNISDFAGLAARVIRPASNLDIYRGKTQNIQRIPRYKPKRLA